MQRTGAVVSAFSVREGARQLLSPRADDVPAITGLRALSLLWVLTQHVHQGLRPLGATLGGAMFLAHPLLRVGWAGNLGVDIFFVISGYLIGGMLMREREERGTLSFSRFYTRRAMRILPTYALAIALHLALTTSQRENAWANVLFVNNFLPFTSAFMAHTWSLAIEEQFYALFPFCVLLLFAAPSRWRTPALALSILAFAVTAIVVVLRNDIELSLTRPNIVQFWRYMDIFYVKPHTRFGGLFIGVLVARLEATRVALTALEKRPVVATLLGVVAVSVLAFVILVFPECRSPSGERLLSGSFGVALDAYAFSGAIGYLLLLSRCRSLPGRVLATALGWRVLHPIAQVSYAAYLLHPLCMTPLFPWLGFDLAHPFLSYGRLMACAIGATLVAAAVVFLVLEHPIMRLRPSPRASAPKASP